MPAQKITREDAVDRIAEAFRAHGYDGTSLSLLSEATGLGRASLYHHFPGGKDDMARAVFAHVGGRVHEHLLAPLAAEGEPEARLKTHLKGVRAFYEGGAKNCLLGAITLSGGSDRFAAELAGSFKGWIDGLARVVQDAGHSRAVARRRAELAVAQIQGALILSRGLDDLGPFRRAVEALPTLLLEEG